MDQHPEFTNYLKVYQVLNNQDVCFYTSLTHGHEYYAQGQINIRG